jgi:hypothetical protein
MEGSGSHIIEILLVYSISTSNLPAPHINFLKEGTENFAAQIHRKYSGKYSGISVPE